MEMLENGLEKVYKWALREIRFVDFDRDVQPSSTKEGHSLHEEISIGMLIQVLSCLRQRQTYLEHCCEEIIIHRRVSLVSSFLSALTSEEGEFGNSRPIEIYAHDPVRYISDMLAWLHQTIASEKDLAVVLFGDTAKNSSPTIDSERSSPKETLLEYYSSKCIDALIRPLQSRIEQVLSNSSNWNKDGSGSFHGFVTAYQIYSVIKFYHKTILSLISKESSMVQALETFANDALRSFFELVQFEGSVLLEQFSIPDETLAPSNSITLYISQISDLFGVFEASLLQSNASVERNDDASFILNTVLDPIMKAIANTASILRLDDSSQKVYHINVLCAVQFVLRKFLFAQTKVETLSLEIDTLLRELIELQVSSLLERFGVSHKLEIINNHDSGTRLCDIEGMDSNSLRISIQKFYQSLSMLSSFSGGDFRGSFLPLCDRLQLQQLRIAARQGVAKALSDTYSSIFEAIHDPGNGYSDPESIFKHSPVQFSTLLEI